MYNAHHKRMWTNSHKALSALGKCIEDTENDPSDTSLELNDKLTKAYALLLEVTNELEKRRATHNQEKAQQRIALKQAKTQNV